MTKLKIDYSEARDWYIKGDKDKEGIKYPSLPDIAREFEYSLSENEDIKQQMQETALLSYILYEDGKIIIDEITPKDRFGDLFDNKSKLHSQSVGKSITSYILGHAICEGYINSLNSKLDDWSAVENTVYHNQNLDL